MFFVIPAQARWRPGIIPIFVMPALVAGIQGRRANELEAGAQHAPFRFRAFRPGLPAQGR